MPPGAPRPTMIGPAWTRRVPSGMVSTGAEGPATTSPLVKRHPAPSSLGNVRLSPTESPITWMVLSVLPPNAPPAGKLTTSAKGIVAMDPWIPEIESLREPAANRAPPSTVMPDVEELEIERSSTNNVGGGTPPTSLSQTQGRRIGGLMYPPQL